MKQLKDWSCDFKLESSTDLTVGQKFAILCIGDTPLDANINPKINFLSEDDAYKLVILRHKLKSPNELFVSLTSWQTGTHNFRDLPMELNSDFILLQPPTLKVVSILKNKEQMNLPPGPLLRNPPEFIWYALILMLFGLGIYFLRMYKKSRVIDRGLLRLNTFKTSLTPFYEFQKQIRSTKKILEKPLSENDLKQLCTEFYKNTVIFMSLQLQAPLFVLNEKDIAKILQKKIQSPKLIQEYFYLTRELKKTALDIKPESDLKRLQADFENLANEANSVSQKINKYFIGMARI